MVGWLESLGFNGNPFDMDPVGSNSKAIEKGFVDRTKERSSAEDFVQLPSGKLLILGNIGEGKSSLLNLLEYNSRTAGRVIMVRIDFSSTRDKQTFFERILAEVQNQADTLSSEVKQELEVKLKDLAISSDTQKKSSKTAASLEGKIGAVIAYLKGTIKQEEGGEDKIEIYVPPRIRKLEGICTQLLPALFDSVPVFIICEDLDKLSDSEIKVFLNETIPLLPPSTLIAVSANVLGLDPSIRKDCSDVLHVPLRMAKIDTPEKLREFIDGRMCKFSEGGKPRISFDNKSVEMLFDRTGGNLRQTFRYCYVALQMFKKNITEQMILEAIKECDLPFLEGLSDNDKQTLDYLATTDGPLTLKEIYEALKDEQGEGKDSFRKRLTKLESLGFVNKAYVKSGRQYEVSYSMPKTLRSLLNAS